MKKGFTTSEMAKLFEYSDATMRKKLKEVDFPFEHKRISGYKNGMYLWFPQDVDVKTFNKLNDKKLYKGIKAFRDAVKLTIKDAERKKEEAKLEREKEALEAQKRRELAIAEKQRKNEEKRIRKEKERIEANRISKEIGALYEHIWYNNTSKYILHIGPTNSGKTHNSIRRLRESKSGQYLAPLRLLAHEIFEELNSDGTACDLFTGEEIINKNSGISSRTIEMADYNNHYDVVVVDECFMISDKDRGKSWLTAIMNIKADEVHVILNLESEQLITDILTKTNKKFTIERYERKVPLVMADNHLSSTKGHLKIPQTIHVFFSRISCLVEKHRLERSGNKVSIIYGALPPEVKHKQVEDFRNGKTNVLVATDAIAMGLNLPCDNIVFRSIEKYDGYTNRKLTSTEIKQIAGRAGRYGLSDKGVVYGYTKGMHNYVREKLNTKTELNTHAYYGVDINIVKLLEGDNLQQKLATYSRLNLIPDKLKDIIKHESTHRYTEVLGKANKFIKSYNYPNIDIDNLWKIITIPYNTDFDMLKNIVESVSKDKKMILNKLKVIHPDDVTTLGKAEQFCKSLDSYLSFAVKFPELIESSNLAEVIKIKEKQYERINTYLLDKKLSSRKRCTSCGKNITVEVYHAKCNSCYQKERRNYYYDDDDDDDFYDYNFHGRGYYNKW